MIIDLKTGKPCDPAPVTQFVSLKDYNVLAHNHNELVDAYHALVHRHKRLEKRIERLESEKKCWWRLR